MSCNALVLYWSKNGNTRKVAAAISDRLASHGIDAPLTEITADLDVDVFAADLVFLGAPVYSNLAPKPVMTFLQKLRSRAAALASAPEKPGKFAVAFCTYGGGHTGVGESIPLLKYIGQVFEHEGVRVVGEWPVVGDFPEVQDPLYNPAGRLGDITGRPNEADLANIAGQVSGLLRRLQHKLGIVELLARKT
jgi:hypothetical protein